MSVAEILANTDKIRKELGLTEKPDMKELLSKLKDTAMSDGVCRMDIIAIKAHYEFRPFLSKLNSNDYTEHRSLIGTNRLCAVIDEIISQL